MTDGQTLANQTLDGLESASFVRRAERERDAAGSGARGATNAMHVVLRLQRQIEVDDM